MLFLLINLVLTWYVDFVEKKNRCTYLDYIHLVISEPPPNQAAADLEGDEDEDAPPGGAQVGALQPGAGQPGVGPGLPGANPEQIRRIERRPRNDVKKNPSQR